jgi:phage-associated protein
MNPQHRNTLIAGINHTMEGLSQIAQALEADGWEGIEDEYVLAGARPVAAARLEEPAFQAELEERLEAQQAASAAPAREYTLEEVRSFLAELSQQGYTA